jgi:hypothetical protein
MDIFIIFGILGIVWGVYNQFRLTRYDGTIHLSVDDDGQRTFFLDLDYSPDELVYKKRIIFRVDQDEL